jgi:hypothetical protein
MASSARRLTKAGAAPPSGTCCVNLEQRLPGAWNKPACGHGDRIDWWRIGADPQPRTLRLNAHDFHTFMITSPLTAIVTNETVTM